MHIEIERKFLVKNDGWRGLATGQSYRQGYLCTDAGRTVRVRAAEDKAFLTIKGLNDRGAAPEFQYSIPLADAHYLLENMAMKPLIEKKRHKIPFKGLIWEVDEFFGDNSGLVLAEVELSSTGQKIIKPAWAGEEVTGDPRYYNASLVTKPYKDW